VKTFKQFILESENSRKAFDALPSTSNGIKSPSIIDKIKTQLNRGVDAIKQTTKNVGKTASDLSGRGGYIIQDIAKRDIMDKPTAKMPISTPKNSNPDNMPVIRGNYKKPKYTDV
jgi:hypothetical protein